MLAAIPRALLARCAGAAAGLGYGLLLADALAPGAMGEFAAAVSVAMVAATVSKCGLDVLLMRRAASRPGDAGGLAARCAGGAGLLGAALWLGGAWAAFEARPDAAWTLTAFLAAIPFLAMSFVLGGLLKAGNLAAAAVFLETGAWQAAMCACAVCLQWLGSDSLAVVAATFAAAAAATFACSAAAAGRLVHRRRRASPGRAAPDSKVRATEVAPLGALAAVQVAMRWSDTLWVAWWLGAEAVAVYAVCTRLAGGVALADHAVNAVTAPRFARHHAHGDARALRAESRRAIGASAALGALAAAAVAALARPVLDLLGAPYSEAAGVAQAAAALMAAHVALVPAGHLAAMSGRAADHLKATALMFAAQQVAFLLLIPPLGMVGALIGFALPQALANLLTLGLLRRPRTSPPERRAAER